MEAIGGQSAEPDQRQPRPNEGCGSRDPNLFLIPVNSDSGIKFEQVRGQNRINFVTPRVLVGVDPDVRPSVGYRDMLILPLDTTFQRETPPLDPGPFTEVLWAD